MSTADWIRFQQMYGFGSVRAAKALEHWHTPTYLFHSRIETLLQQGLTRAECDRLQKIKEKSIDPVLEYCERNQIRILTPDSEYYPERLKQIYSPPAVLYVAGYWNDINDILSIAVVGTRRCTEYGAAAARSISTELVQNGVITVSGLAAGIDACCHEATVKAGGRTIAVQGCGVDKTYPPENTRLKEEILASGGAVISEFPPGTDPIGYHFPIRNRVIAGLSHGVLVVEGEQRSGSLITAGFALTEGRDVFAVPGNIDRKMSEAPNWLIREGAVMTRNAEDILQEYPLKEFTPAASVVMDDVQQISLYPAEKAKPKAAKKEKEQKPAAPAASLAIDHLTADQRLIWEALGDEALTADELTEKTGLAVSKVLSVLTQLEIFGIINVRAGHRFSR